MKVCRLKISNTSRKTDASFVACYKLLFHWGPYLLFSDVGEAAEDALLNFCGQSYDESNEKEASQPTLRPYQPGERSLNNRRSRGLAWLGLERARESVGWLPAETTIDNPSTLEDSERQPQFEEIEPFLLEIHLDPQISDENVLQRRKQRLLLLFLEFLGVWDANVAREYKLPAGKKSMLINGKK